MNCTLIQEWETQLVRNKLLNLVMINIHKNDWNRHKKYNISINLNGMKIQP